MTRVPDGDLRRNQADDADPYVPFGAITVQKGSFEDGALKQVVRQWLHERNIGRNDRMTGMFQNELQVVQAIVELMVAQGSGIKPQRIHGTNGRVRLIGGPLAGGVRNHV